MPPELEMIWCCGFNGEAVVRVTINVERIELPAGHYYCAVRLVGTGPDCNCQFFAARTDGGIRGETEGYFQSDFFGYPDWTPVSEVLGIPMDFSFWLTGELSQPDCERIRRVRARTNCDRQKVIARVKTGLPEGTELGLTLDGGRPQPVVMDDRGRARAVWKEAAGGEVCVGGCENKCATAPGCG
ncbi:MAG: hypothetical protein FLDDKLPJ_00710 [Phycisphaerae bacterium]|nr:hypothetical protein [Phycisphaerae bacterium]